MNLVSCKRFNFPRDAQWHGEMCWWTYVTAAASRGTGPGRGGGHRAASCPRVTEPKPQRGAALIFLVTVGGGREIQPQPNQPKLVWCLLALSVWSGPDYHFYNWCWTRKVDKDDLLMLHVVSGPVDPLRDSDSAPPACWHTPPCSEDLLNADDVSFSCLTEKQ